MNELYTLLHTQPTVPHSWEVGMLAIPARTALPTDTNALVELADQVYQALLQAPAQCAAVGIKPHKLIQFKASLKRCAPHKGIVRHNNNSIGTYDRQLNSCLRHLVERVDPVTIRFAEHTAFSTAYKAARRPLLKLEVAARRNVKSVEPGLVVQRGV